MKIFLKFSGKLEGQNMCGAVPVMYLYSLPLSTLTLFPSKKEDRKKEKEMKRKKKQKARKHIWLCDDPSLGSFRFFKIIKRSGIR
jgi:hypothetical protein